MATTSQAVVWVAIYESGSYSSYSLNIEGVYATRAAAKKALIAWAEMLVDADVADTKKRYPDGKYPNGTSADPDEHCAYRRHQYGLDDYRWFDSKNGSRFAPEKPHAPLVDRKGQINMNEMDFRDDFLSLQRWDVKE